MGAIVAPRPIPERRSQTALPWLAGAVSLAVHAGAVAALATVLLADAVEPPAPLPTITVSIAPGPPGAPSARAATHANATAARQGEETAKQAKTAAPPRPPDPPARPAARTPDPPARAASPKPAPKPDAKPDRPRAAADETKPAPKAAADPPRPVSPAQAPPAKAPPAKAPPDKAPLPPPKVAEAPPKRPKPAEKPIPKAADKPVPKTVPAAKPPRAAARATPAPRPSHNRTEATRPPARGRQVASLPGTKDSFTPPRYVVGGGVNRPPVYPRRARRLGWEGRVVLRVRVDSEGRVETISLGRSSGHDVLDRAAIDAVRRWRFAPATRGATPVAAWVEVPIRFRLTDGT